MRKGRAFMLIGMLTHSRFLTFHIVVISIVLTSIFMLFTAGELGPMAAIFVPLGLYLIVFCACMEGLFFARLGVARVWMHWQRRRGLRHTDRMAKRPAAVRPA